jgi:glycosyltransferase involved in cell wall biosynthesis
MSQYRVTLVMPSASKTGGAEEAFCQLLKSIAAKQAFWQVVFLEDGPLVAWTQARGHRARVVRCGRTREVWRWWRSATEISQYAKEFHSNLIFGWMTKGHVYGGLAAWQCRIDAVWFQMGLPERGFLDKASRVLPTKAVLCCSEFVANLQRKKQPNVKVHAVPLGVDTERFTSSLSITKADARKNLGLPADRPIVGIVGRLQAWKGMHVLLDAMALVNKEHTNALCLIVGGTYPAEQNYPNMLRDQISRLGLQHSALMVGAQTNVQMWMRAMDVIVHASEREPFGIVVVEGLCLGRPVIATTPGGPDEIIKDGDNGFLVRFGDAVDLAERISQVLRNPMLIDPEMTQASSLRFTDEAFAERTMVAIEAILRK